MSDDCAHSTFKPEFRTKMFAAKEFGLGRLMYLLLTAKCTACGKPFLFEGDFGFSSTSPTVSDDMTELRVPMRYPLSEDDTKRFVPNH